MTDIEKWELAVATVSDEFHRLAQEVMTPLRRLLEEIKGAKRKVHLHADNVHATQICASCGGECCLVGKYHFTVIDLLVFLADERAMFTPRFVTGHCPFLGAIGCVMEPAYRPYNCITFNCDRIDSLLEPQERSLFTEAEYALREACLEVERMFENRFMQGLLINCERDLLQGRVPILRGDAVRGNSVPRAQVNDRR